MTHSDPPETPNSQAPKDPKVNDHWIDDAGDVWTWDGNDWMPLEVIPYFAPTSTERPDR
jgi:hypothetical protein